MSQCPSCGARKTQVLATDHLANGWTRRRRRCTWGCDGRWNTYELADSELDLSGHDKADLAKADRLLALDAVESLDGPKPAQAQQANEDR